MTYLVQFFCVLPLCMVSAYLHPVVKRLVLFLHVLDTSGAQRK